MATIMQACQPRMVCRGHNPTAFTAAAAQRATHPSRGLSQIDTGISADTRAVDSRSFTE